LDALYLKSNEKIKIKQMNLAQWILIWFGLAALVLISALVGGLVQPPPDIGGVPQQFTGNVSYIVAATCVPNGTIPVTPQTNRNNQSNMFFFGNSSADPRRMSQLVWAWAQFIQHDIFLFSTNPNATYNISLAPSGLNMTLQQLNRIAANCSSLNGRTMLLDGSPIYSDAISPGRLILLRTGNFGTMSQSVGGYLPIVNGSFLAGDVNVNENPQLVSLVTLFVREHNFWCRQLKQINPTWTDDQLFWKARSYVLVEIQRITMEEWLPIVLGGYLGINPPIVPTLVFNVSTSYVSAEFATIGSEFYRSLLNNNNTYNVSNVTSSVLSNGLDNILQNAWRQPSLSFDVRASSAQCNGSQAFDFITAALTRAQELGITTNYATLCQTFGTTPSSVPFSGAILGNVWNEAPPTVPGSSLQFTTIAILMDQLLRSAAVDANWYKLPSTAANVGTTFYPILSSTTLAQIIYRNTQIPICVGCNVETSAFWIGKF
jgi:hypothetical protein